MNDYTPQQSKSMASPPPLPDTDEHARNTKLRIVGLVIAVVIVAVAIALALPFGNKGSAGMRDTTRVGSATSSEESEPATGGRNHHSTFGSQAKSATDSGSLNSGTAADTSSIDIPEIALPKDAGSKTNTSGEGSARTVPTPAIPTDIESVADAAPEDISRAMSFFTLGDSQPERAARQPAARSGAESKAEFFGVQARGKRFVYVVDVSSSMFGTKFEKARHELVDSIESLGRDQYVFVAFFNHDAFYQPIDRLTIASSKNKKRINAWIMQAVPSGGTSPFQAVAYAIQLRPDSIFLLSDGEFQMSEVSNIRNENLPLRVPIHTIGFQTDAHTLKIIAEENNGTYRHVP